MTGSRSPVRLAILDDYQIVIEGVAAMLAPYQERLEVIELDAGKPVVSQVDVVLFDTFAQGQGTDVDVNSVLGDSGGRLVIYSWNLESELVDGALAAGASGYLWKGMSAEEMVEALESVRDGGRVRPPEGVRVEPDSGRWPGQAHGLSARESEILALIAQGLTNDEMTKQVYLTINTIKSYIRTAYRKIGVTRRAQAVAWAIEHGFEPDHVRERR